MNLGFGIAAASLFLSLGWSSIERSKAEAQIKMECLKDSTPKLCSVLKISK
jgi:hypothetical protein